MFLFVCKSLFSIKLYLVVGKIVIIFIRIIKKRFIGDNCLKIFFSCLIEIVCFKWIILIIISIKIDIKNIILIIEVSDLIFLISFFNNFFF